MAATVSVTTAATALLARNQLPRGGDVLLYNEGAAIVYIGYDNGVTAATGIPFNVGEKWAFSEEQTRGFSNGIFGITPSGTATVRVQFNNNYPAGPVQ